MCVKNPDPSIRFKLSGRLCLSFWGHAITWFDKYGGERVAYDGMSVMMLTARHLLG
jgi:hypothetical protein